MDTTGLARDSTFGKDSDLRYWADVGRPQKDPMTGEMMPADESEQNAFCTSVQDKQRDYFDSAQKQGILGQWIASYAALHGLEPDSLSTMQTQQIGYEGPEAEFVRLYINIARTYLQRQATMVLSQTPTLKCKVSNSNTSSQLAARLGDDILGYSFKRATKDQKLRDATIAAGFVGTGYGHLRWDPMGGDMVEVERPENDNAGQPLMDQSTGKPAMLKQQVKSGAPKLEIGYPWTVFKDPEESSDVMWSAARVVDNRHNLIATHAAGNAELARKIMGADTSDLYDFSTLFGYQGVQPENKDRVTTIHFYHKRCAAMPAGRYVIMLDKLILWDGPCPVADGIPIAEMCPARWIMTTFGYAPWWDLLSIQQALNQIVSDMLSNIATFGRQSLAMEKGTEITTDDVATGQRGFFYPQGGKPPAAVLLNDLGTGPSVLQEYLHKMLDDVSGQNAASRGDPDANVKSGQFAALLHTVASEYMSYWQASTDAFVETLSNYMLDMFQTYGETPFLYEVVGLDNRIYVKEFTKNDIAGFKGAVVETVSPMLRNTAGRLQLHEMLSKYPPNERAAAWEFIDTGRSDAFMKTDRNSQLYIQRENENLIKGTTRQQMQPILDQMGQPVMNPQTGEPFVQVVNVSVVQVNEFDNPFTHIVAHWADEQALLAADEPDYEAIDRLHQHSLEHAVKYTQMHPVIAQCLGIPAPPIMPGNAAFMFAGAIAEANATIAMMTGGAPAPGGDPMQGAQPTGDAAGGGGGNGMPKNNQTRKLTAGGPGGDNTSGAAQEGGSGVDSSGVQLPTPAAPPPSMQPNL